MSIETSFFTAGESSARRYIWTGRVNSIVFTLLMTISPAYAGSIKVVDSGGMFTAQVTSLKELRFRNTVRQEHDFSCGSAALATLLTYHYNDPVTEQDVFKVMFENGDKEKIQHEGFSLLDMKQYLETHGYHADGYWANLDKVAAVGMPVIVLINNGGYLHFVVIKGVNEEKVLIGDPATGTRTVTRDEFKNIWNGLVFVVHEKKQIATSTFNDEATWRIREKAPLGAALSRDSLAASVLLLPAHGDF